MCKQCFFRTPSINYSGVIVQGRNPLPLVSGGISWGVVVWASSSRPNYSGKNVLEAKVQQAIALVKFLGDNSPGGNNSGVIVRGAEVRGVVVLGGSHRGQLSGELLSSGALFRGNFPRGESGVNFTRGNFMGGTRLGGGCPERNVRIPLKPSCKLLAFT